MRFNLKLHSVYDYRVYVATVILVILLYFVKYSHAVLVKSKSDRFCFSFCYPATTVRTCTLYVRTRQRFSP